MLADGVLPELRVHGRYEPVVSGTTTPLLAHAPLSKVSLEAVPPVMLHCGAPPPNLPVGQLVQVCALVVDWY